ncbi:MAG: hypothetical protein HJJLKODD_02473 [Phycisphaerae bacterium]|nr:hypothetical protein [Phycisphaerae bacterium]
MAIWVTKPGPLDTYQRYYQDQQVVCLPMVGLSSLEQSGGMEHIRQALWQVPGYWPAQKLSLWAAQARAFRYQCRPGDLMAIPLRTAPMVLLGEVVGDYVYNASAALEFRHERAVRWAERPIENEAVDADLLYSLRVPRIFGQVRLPDAEQRFRGWLGGGAMADQSIGVESIESAGANPHNWQYRQSLRTRWTGADFVEVVGGVLAALGYCVTTGRRGADSGCDLLASRGPLGFDGPRIGVQVKLNDRPVSAPVVRELVGAMRLFQATHGLFVSWGGFSQVAEMEMMPGHFHIRVWDGATLLQQACTHRARLPARVRALLNFPTENVTRNKRNNHAVFNPVAVAG